LKTPEEKAKLQEAVTKLLTTLKGDRKPVILVRSGFWANAAKDEALRGASDAVGGTFADIGALAKDKSLYGRAEREFKHDGVANHPGDKGMAAIADALMKALSR
jgi:thiamine pyrophosphate-dependent acetolactate synthase large subunit-like protein